MFSKSKIVQDSNNLIGFSKFAIQNLSNGLQNLEQISMMQTEMDAD